MNKFLFFVLLAISSISIYGQIKIDTTYPQINTRFFDVKSKYNFEIEKLYQWNDEIILRISNKDHSFYRFDGNELYNKKFPHVQDSIIYLSQREEISLILSPKRLHVYKEHKLIKSIALKNKTYLFCVPVKEDEIILVGNNQIDLYYQDSIYQKIDHVDSLYFNINSYYFKGDSLILNFFSPQYTTNTYIYYKNNIIALSPRIKKAIPYGDKILTTDYNEIYQLLPDNQMIKTNFLIKKDEPKIYDIVPYSNNSLLVKTNRQYYFLKSNHNSIKIEINKNDSIRNKNVFIDNLGTVYFIYPQGFYQLPYCEIWKYNCNNQSDLIKRYMIDEHWLAIYRDYFHIFKRDTLFTCYPGRNNKIIRAKKIDSVFFFITKRNTIVYNYRSDQFSEIYRPYRSFDIFEYNNRFYLSFLRKNDTPKHTVYEIDLAHQTLLEDNPLKNSKGMTLGDNSQLLLNNDIYYSTHNKKKIHLKNNSLSIIECENFAYNDTNNFYLKDDENNYHCLLNGRLKHLSCLKHSPKDLSDFYLYSFLMINDSLLLAKKNDQLFLLKDSSDHYRVIDSLKIETNSDKAANIEDDFHYDKKHQLIYLARNQSISVLFISSINNRDKIISYNTLTFKEEINDIAWTENKITILTQHGIYRFNPNFPDQLETVKRFDNFLLNKIITSDIFSAYKHLIYLNDDKTISLTPPIISGTNYYSAIYDSLRKDFYFLGNMGVTQIPASFFKNRLKRPSISLEKIKILPDGITTDKIKKLSSGYKDIIMDFNIKSLQHKYKLYYSINQSEWVQLSTNNQIILNNMGPGSYHLKVKLIGNHYLNTPLFETDFEIDYFWWQKWYIIAMLILFFSLSVFLISRSYYHSYIRKVKIDTQLNSLKEVHNYFGFPSSYNTKFYKVESFHKPNFIIGGDFFETYQINNNESIVILGDISGHDLDTSLIMSHVKGFLSGFNITFSHHAKMLYELNRFVINKYEFERYLTLVLLHIDIEKRTIRFISAGHPLPFYYRAKSKQSEFIKTNTFPIGLISDFTIKSQTIQYQSDDLIFIYTDGIYESYKNHTFEAMITEFFHQKGHTDLKKIKEELIYRFNIGRNNDDESFLLIRLK